MSLRASDLSLESIFPTFPAVKRLVVVKQDNHDTDRMLWLRSLQGLANKVEPHVWVANGSTEDTHWLTLYTEKHGIPVEKHLSDLEFLKEYAHLAKGYIVYDIEKVIQTQNIALTLCGLDGVLPVSPAEEQFAIEAGIPKVDDLRGRFSSDREAAYWAVENLWPRCNKRMIAQF